MAFISNGVFHWSNGLISRDTNKERENNVSEGISVKLPVKDSCVSHPPYCVSVCILRQLPGSSTDSVFIGIVWTPQLEKPFLNPCGSMETHTLTHTLISYHLSGQGFVCACVLSASNEEQDTQLFLV